jgi:hypothetical protein
MTIKRGEAWGERLGPLPRHGVVVASDGEARLIVEAALRANEPIPPLGLTGGDLWRTLGGTKGNDRLRTDEAVTFTCDLGEVLVDGVLHRFVSHLQARRAWWHGRAWLAMNASWIGSWNVAPRSHPNDGLLDVHDVRLRPAERLAARRRVRTGSHVPHPRIAERRVPAIQVGFDRPTPVLLDGLDVGEARTLSVRLEPDALTVVV